MEGGKSVQEEKSRIRRVGLVWLVETLVEMRRPPCGKERREEGRMEERMPAVRNIIKHIHACTLVKMVGMVASKRKTVAA